MLLYQCPHIRSQKMYTTCIIDDLELCYHPEENSKLKPFYKQGIIGYTGTETWSLYFYI